MKNPFKRKCSHPEINIVFSVLPKGTLEGHIGPYETRYAVDYIFAKVFCKKCGQLIDHASTTLHDLGLKKQEKQASRSLKSIHMKEV